MRVTGGNIMENLMVNTAKIPDLKSIYRVIVVDAYEIEYVQGGTFFEMHYVLFNSKNGEMFDLTEEFCNVKNNVRTDEFFTLLRNNGITFDNIDDLIGMVFESNISIEVHNGNPYVVTSNRTLVAKPVMSVSKVIDGDGNEDLESSFWC